MNHSEGSSKTLTEACARGIEGSNADLEKVLEYVREYLAQKVQVLVIDAELTSPQCLKPIEKFIEILGFDIERAD